MRTSQNQHDTLCVPPKISMIRCAYLPESAWYVCVPPRISLVRLRTTQNQHGTHSVPYGLAFIAGGANKFACLLGYLVHKVLRPAGMANLAQNVRDGIANPAPLWGAIKSVAGVQGLPCDGASKQGKPCTPSVSPLREFPRFRLCPIPAYATIAHGVPSRADFHAKAQRKSLFFAPLRALRETSFSRKDGKTSCYTECFCLN